MTVVDIDAVRAERDPERLLAWAVLRRLVEASRTDVVRLLWPDGDAAAPARVTRLVEMLRQGDSSLPAGLQGLTAEKTAQITQQAEADLQWARVNRWRLITPDDPEWPTRRLEESFGTTRDLEGPVRSGGAVRSR